MVATLVMTTPPRLLITTTTITKITTGEDEHYGEVIHGAMTGTIISLPPVLPPPRSIILLLVGARLHMHPNSSHILHPNRRAHPKSIIVLLDLLVVVAAAAFMKKVSSPYTLTHFDYTYYITLLSLYITLSLIAIPL